MTDSLPEQLELPPPPPRGVSQFARWLIAGAVVIVLVGLVVAIRDLPDRSNATTMESPAPATETEIDLTVDPTDKTPQPTNPLLIDDDGSTQWASPTAGTPLDLAYLPPGVQIILAVRPNELLAHPEGEKIIASLGPLCSDALQSLERITKIPLKDMDRLLVGWQIARDGNWQTTLVVTMSTTTVESEPQEATSLKYYKPPNADNRILVIAPPELFAEIQELDGHAPPLTRGMERLLDHAGSARMVTLLFAPNFLFSDGGSIFTGEWSHLREPLFWFLGDDLGAVAISMNCDENLFLELIAVPTLNAAPEASATTLAKRVADLPARAESHIASLTPNPYSREMLARFPAMIRQLAAYTRASSDDDCAMLRCYLPAVAAHNLPLGFELTMAESGGSNQSGVAGTTTSPALTIAERLQTRTSLRFSRDTLEAALRMLSADISVPITISGPDLQADGITKNQSFGIDLADKPAAEILVEILRLANPDKLATGPTDPRQKLVYIIQQASDETEEIVITTRAAAQKRRDKLPAVFDASPRK